MPLHNNYYILLFSKSGVIYSKVKGKIQPIIFGVLFSSSVESCNNLGFSNVKTRRLSYPLFSMVAVLPLLCWLQDAAAEPCSQPLAHWRSGRLRDISHRGSSQRFWIVPLIAKIRTGLLHVCRAWFLPPSIVFHFVCPAEKS